jgi:CrcB protein
LKQVLLIFIGGGLGSLARFGVSKAFYSWSSIFPFGTLTANILACFILGVLSGWAALSSSSSVTDYRAFVAVGFCGGFSTFSTFTNETIQLITIDRWAEAFMNVFVSLILCFLATFAGLWLGRQILSV